MSVIFKLDGTIVREDDVKDEQQDLKDKLANYDEHIKHHYEGLRSYRDRELTATDWTQGADSPLNSDKKAEWQTYRNKLRDLPNHAKAPIWFEESEIPLAPGQSSVPNEALAFVKSHIDAIGIGTTSWIGVGTDGVYFEQDRPCKQISYDLSAKVEGISTNRAVIGTNNGFDFIVSISDMAAEGEYHYQIETDPETIYINRGGFVTITPDSNYVGIATIPVSISGVAGTITSNTDVKFIFEVSETQNHYEEYVVGIATTSVGVGTT